MKRAILIYIIYAALCQPLLLCGQSLSDYLPSARKGDAVAEYNAAQCYLHGWGTPVDSAHYRHYLRLSAEGGLERAATDMATLLSPTHPALAAHWRGEAPSIPHRYNYISYDEACYYGEVRGGQRDGYGTLLWDSGVTHTGEWEDGEPYGMGITIFPDQIIISNTSLEASGLGAIILTAPDIHFPDAPEATRFVGYIDEGTPAGEGTLYASDGRLLYYGPFRDGRPADDYPSTGNYGAYTWGWEMLSSGDSWMGEMASDVRHGFGVYRWKDGSLWLGWWENGLRQGTGLYIRHDGALMSGHWQNGALSEN